MPVPLVALIAAAIYESRSQLGDLDSMNRALSLLASAKGDDRLSLEVGDPDLLVNGTPLSPAAPGLGHRPPGADRSRYRCGSLCQQTPRSLSCAKLSSCMRRHRVSTRRSTTCATRCAPPCPTSWSPAAPARQPKATCGMHSSNCPGFARHPLASSRAVRPPDPHHAGLAGLAARLDPMLQSAAEARDSHDYGRLAQILLQIRELESGTNEELGCTGRAGAAASRAARRPREHGAQHSQAGKLRDDRPGARLAGTRWRRRPAQCADRSARAARAAGVHRRTGRRSRL